MKRFNRLSILALTLLVAACGAAQPPAGARGAQSALRPATSPCDVSNEWYFHGACIQHVLPASGYTFKLAKYRGYVLAIAIAKNNGNGTAKVTGSDATGKGDIGGTYKGAKFPLYGSTCHYNGKREKCPGKAFLYLHVTSDNAKEITLDGVPSATLTSEGGYSGTKCFPADLYGNTQWVPQLSLAKAPQGDSLSLMLGKSSGKQFIPPHADLVLAFACE